VLARCYKLWSCVCFCHKPEFYRNCWTDRAGFRAVASFDLSLTPCCEIQVSSLFSGTLSDIQDSENCAIARRSSQCSQLSSAGRSTPVVLYTKVNAQCDKEVTTVVGRTTLTELATFDRRPTLFYHTERPPLCTAPKAGAAPRTGPSTAAETYF